jgi:hypothetical protein
VTELIGIECLSSEHASQRNGLCGALLRAKERNKIYFNSIQNFYLPWSLGFKQITYLDLKLKGGGFVNISYGLSIKVHYHAGN